MNPSKPDAYFRSAGDRVAGAFASHYVRYRSDHTARVAGSIVLIIFLAAAFSPLYPQTSAKPAQKAFASPEDAVQALIEATGKYDVPALTEILGPDSKDLVASDDAVEARNNAVAFSALAREKNSIVYRKNKPAQADLLVGKDDWPLPIPLVKRNGKWYFDTSAGRKEILLRRIGENELAAIQVCRGFVEAQHEYASVKRDGSDVNQYAQRIISTAGKHDGLAWQNPDGSWGGPVGEAVAKAIEQGYPSQAGPFHGYYFKVLKGQGPAAPLGQMGFVVQGAMIGGFALAAAPAQYKVTGVATFIVSHSGIVYQKDLGPNTLALFQAMDRYNPDKTWTETHDDYAP
jgi:hypothetical protein